jgi:acyl carrier protein
MDCTEEVKEFIVEEFLPDITVDQLASDYDLLNGGVIDSLGLLKVIAWLEDRFEVVIDDLDIGPEDFRSVDAISRFVMLQRTSPSGQ